MKRNAKHRASTLGRTIRRQAAFGLTVTVIGGGLFLAPASALEGPNTADDFYEQVGRGRATFDVLGNDAWDPAHTARVVSAQVVGQPFASYSYRTGPNSQQITAPTVTVNPDDTITVDFGAYTLDTPSLYRVAEIAYALRDSAGQSATGYARIVERRDDEPIQAADDTYPAAGNGVLRISSESGDWVGVNTNGRDLLDNDSFGALGAVRVEILSDPALGTVEVERQPGFFQGNPAISNGLGLTYTPRVDESEWVSTWNPDAYTSIEQTAERADSFSYRICSTVTSECSASADASLTYLATRTAKLPQGSAVQTYWTGGPMSDTFDPREGALQNNRWNDAYVAGVEAGTPVLANVRGNTDFGDLADNGDGTWTHTRAPGQTAGQKFVVEWRDSAERVLAVTDLGYYNRDADALTLTDDEVWVARGQVSTIRPLLNDALPFGQNLGSSVAWVGAPQPSWVRDVAPAMLGDARWNGNDSGTRTSVSANDRIMYTAGDVIGTEVVPYTICSPYPTDAGCATANMTIHVAPLVAAENDATDVEAGSPVTIPVLGNDTFTDIPKRNASVTLLDLPAGITAEINSDRTVTVVANPSMRGKAIDFDYLLADFTGSTTATVTIDVADEDAPPPVVAPDAADDATQVVAGSSVTVDVLANDTHGANPTVTMASGAPPGVTTEVTDNQVEVKVSDNFDGDTINLDYLLTDVTGLSDTATLTVAVKRPAPDAVNDWSEAKRGETILVHVLRNDTYSDTPNLATVTVGGNATAADEREVLITIPSNFKGDTFTTEYTLSDRGGSDTATVTVRVAPRDVPPTIVTPPKARDDRAKAAAQVPVTVSVLENDDFAGKATVEVLKDSVPRGVTAKVSDTNRVILTADESRAGQTVALRYRLTDKTGKADTATIRVAVANEVIYTTGANRTFQAYESVARNSGEVSTVGGGATVLFGFGLLALAGLCAGLLGFRRFSRVRQAS